MTIFRYVTLITVQNDLHCSLCTIMRVSQIICCHTDNVIISPNAVSRIHDSLQEFLFACNFCWYTTSFMYPYKKQSRGERPGDLAGQANWPKRERSARQ